MKTMINADQLDVVVRFHDVRRTAELERCIFSLVGQEYRPVHIILTLQRFSAADVELVRSRIAPLLTADHAPTFEILNWDHATPADARSALLNIGVRAARGRYLAFLDYDDVLYPEAYRLMVEKLHTSGADIAFATVRFVELEVFGSFFRPRAVLREFVGTGLRDLFRGNFCPLHSYVLDRTRIPEHFIFFEPSLAMEEDYDFLLRICAEFASDFSLLGNQIGEYYLKTDSSNTHAGGGQSPEWHGRYGRVAAFVEQRRQNTVLSEQVQRALGSSPPRRDLSIRAFLDSTA